MPEIRSETSLLVVFADLTRFASQSQRVGDVELADGIDAYYEQVAASVQDAGGRVVKFVGDGVLLALAEGRVDRGRQAPRRHRQDGEPRRHAGFDRGHALGDRVPKARPGAAATVQEAHAAGHLHSRRGPTAAPEMTAT